MVDFNRDNIVQLLSKAGSIIEKYEAISRETGGNFNIFEIADISTKETTICRVIQELLSPSGRHGQGGIYLKLFLRDCIGLDFSDNEIEKALVKREKNAEGRRIDITVTIANCFIPIEVKIYAKEGSEQCYAYYKYALAQNKQSRYSPRLYYLTRIGEPPSDEKSIQLADEMKIICISFKDNIRTWLESCLTLPETIRLAPIREILIQLLSSVKKFTNQLEDKPMEELVELLSDSEHNMVSAKALADTLEKCRLPKVKLFFNAVNEKMSISLEQISVYEYENNPLARLGLVYMTRHDVELGIDLVFVIEAETKYKSPLYAGYALMKEGRFYEDSEIIKNCKELFSDIENKEDTPGWVFWDFIEYDGKRIDLLNPSGDNDNYFKLFDPDKFKSITESTVEQAMSVLQKLK